MRFRQVEDGARVIWEEKSDLWDSLEGGGNCRWVTAKVGLERDRAPTFLSQSQ